MDQKIADLFNGFAGRKILAVPEYLGKVSGYGSTHPDWDDPLLTKMRQIATDNQLRFRALFPRETLGDYSYDGRRVNAHVVEGQHGEYRIQRISIG